MALGTSGFSDSSFTVLYLPSVAMAFLWSTPGVQIWSIDWTSLGYSFSIELLGLIALVALIGSIQHHAIIKAIFGASGPALNPKSQAAARRGLVSILLQTRPEKVPEIRNNLEIIAFMLDKRKIVDIRHLWKFTPVFVLQILAVGLIPIYAALILATETTGFIPILIFMALFTFKFRSWVSGPVPLPRPDKTRISQLEFEEETKSRPQRAS